MAQKIRITRRKFLIALEGLIGAAVVGWIVVPKTSELLVKQNETSLFPELLDCLQVKEVDGGAGLFDTSEPGEPVLVCKVNETGGSILRNLNGKNSFDDIVQHMIGQVGSNTSDPLSFAGGIATFIAGLAEAGFMKKPFYLRVIENTMVS